MQALWRGSKLLGDSSGRHRFVRARGYSQLATRCLLQCHISDEFSNLITTTKGQGLRLKVYSVGLACAG